MDGRHWQTCKICDGPLLVLGVLGWTRHVKCRHCGLEDSQLIGPDECPECSGTLVSNDPHDPDWLECDCCDYGEQR
jgi:primosomal protein N'